MCQASTSLPAQHMPLSKRIATHAPHSIQPRDEMHAAQPNNKYVSGCEVLCHRAGHKRCQIIDSEGCYLGNNLHKSLLADTP